MNYIILNDVNSNTIQGLLIQNLPPITKPKIRTNIEEIDGKDGDIITKLGYSAYDKEFDIGLYGSYDVNEVISYFNSEGTVIFSNEDDKFYKYTIIEQIDFERLIRFKTAKVKMHVQPFKYSNTDEDIEIYATETDAEDTNITINNTENGASFLDIQLKGQTTQDSTPTPTSPVNVNVVTGNTSVLISNKNLFDKNNITEITGIINTTTHTIVDTGGRRTLYIPCRPNTTYTVSKIVSYRFVVATFPDLTGEYTNVVQNNASTSLTITSGANDKYLAVFYYHSSYDNDRQAILDSIQIEVGSTATTYVAHQEQNYTINLGTIELCEIGGYQDYIYKNNGNWYIHKEIGKIVLNGSENWGIANTGTSNFYYQVAGLTTPKSQDIMPISNYFIGIAITNSNTNIGAWIISSGTIRLRTITEDTVANFKTWLSNNNVTLYYVLNTPTETQITDENLISQLEGLRGASTYINQTNIITSGDLAPIIYVNVDTIDTNEIEVVNSGNYYSKPVVTITGIGTINLYLNDYQVFILELGDTETTITLDVENMEAYNINTGQLMNRQVTGDYNNFIFNSGTNIITWSGTIASVQVVNYSRWI